MDAATSFKNTTFPKYLENWNIEHHYVTPEIHRGNGQVERYMRTIRNLLRIETRVKAEWPSGLWKIQLVLNTTVQKSTNSTPLQLLLGIQSSTPLIQALLKNVSKDLSSIRNQDLDRRRVAEKLSSTRDLNDVNKRRRDNVQYSPGDFVLMHRDSQMHISKSDYEFLGPYEVVNCLDNGRYEIKKVGTNIVTKAAKEQLRRWPTQWALNVDMNEVLDFLESESDSVEREDRSSGEKCVESVAVVRKAV
ncbi:uncharacterized protein LOC123322299 [Coccinella septempunctata]|uniref:uncharacterized protein LOC123322299 n=1 Tax=Coccinella septempunctata TaxID=41139 RepID=UPI001D07320D|nr:uncharacterized protein LOC123322299 [Coccinella septempunctata]